MSIEPAYLVADLKSTGVFIYQEISRVSNPYLARISVTKITPINKGNIKAFASVKLGDTLTINSIKVVQQAGQKAYVRLPESEQNGKYFPVVSADDKLFQEALQEKVLAAWEIDASFGARGK